MLKNQVVSCEGCDAQCCRYVSLQIDTPRSLRDYDHIRWYLLHRDVNVFVDHEDDWCLEFKAVCHNLGEDHRCRDYANRPVICREHGNEHGCEETAADPYELHAQYFSSVEEFDAYLAKRRKRRKAPCKRAG